VTIGTVVALQLEGAVAVYEDVADLLERHDASPPRGWLARMA
jgi:hypothetical protein